MITTEISDEILRKQLGHKSSKGTVIYDPFQIERAIKKIAPSRIAIDQFWGNKKTVE